MESILNAVGTSVESVLGWFTTTFGGISELFIQTVDGATQPTFLGWILAVPIAVLVVRFGFDLILRLIRSIRVK